MTYREDFTLPAELLEQVQEQGLDVLPELIRVIINIAMQAERAEHLNAGPYQHTLERRGYANGFKPKTMQSRVGDITFSVPQVREGGFYPQAFFQGLRSERALTLTLAEMYVQGVSTRKVKAITEQLCGVDVSSSQVSRAAAEMDSELEKWRERPLGEYPYLFLDAYYEQVREDGQVRHLAILVAVAVTHKRKSPKNKKCLMLKLGLDLERALSFIIRNMETLTVKEASEYIGLTAHTLRYYERIGLIEPVARNRGGHRRYAQTDLEHLKFLHCLRDSGMSIQGMQQYATLTSQGHDTLGARLELLESHKREVQARIHELEDKLAIINAKIRRFRQAG